VTVTRSRAATARWYVNFNGTGELINPNYGGAVLARVTSTHRGKNGTVSDLSIVYRTVGTDAAAFVEYPVSGGVPDIAQPTATTTCNVHGLQ
jgi:hypothetical protein